MSPEWGPLAVRASLRHRGHIVVQYRLLFSIVPLDGDPEPILFDDGACVILIRAPYYASADFEHPGFRAGHLFLSQSNSTNRRMASGRRDSLIQFTSITRLHMRPAIERAIGSAALDIRVVETPHRRCVEKDRYVPAGISQQG